MNEPTYYGRPVIKSPVWIWTIPAYFYAGGVAGAAMVLGTAAQVFGQGREMRVLSRRCHWIGAVAGGLGGVLLIADLGRPSRFLNMLRVFRPTSPMSIGSWVLAAATPCSLSAALFPGSLLGDVGGYGAGILGVPLAGYTAVLVANTAVPVWQQSRRWLPVLFIASSMSGAASLLQFFRLPSAARRSVRIFGMIGAVVEHASTRMVEREASVVEQVGRPLRQGATGIMWKAATVMTVASMAIALFPGGGRRKQWLSGALGTLGSLCLRYAIVHAGKVSARDPRATFRQQRAGYGAAEVTGSVFPALNR